MRRTPKAASSLDESRQIGLGIRGKQRKARSSLVLGGFYPHLVSLFQLLKVSRWKPLVQHKINDHAGHRYIKPDRESEFPHFSMAIKPGTKGRYYCEKDQG